MPHTWSKKDVIRSIQERKRKGKKLNHRNVLKSYPSLHKAGRRFYGSWGRALRGAGIDTNKIDERGRKTFWTKQRLIAEIRKLHRSKEPLYARHILLNHGRLYGAAGNLFGGWAQAITAAGLDYSTIQKRLAKKWTKKMVLHEIKNRRAKNLPLNEWEAGSILTSPARRLFGSWLKAIHAAGLTYEQIRKRDYRKREWWTPKRVLMRIRQLEKKGVRLNPKALEKTNRSLYWYGRYFFGTWYKAVETAGFSYKKHYRNWSTKAWLYQMSDKEYEAQLK